MRIMKRAVTHFRAALGKPDLPTQQQNQILFDLGRAFLWDGHPGDAITIFNQLLQLAQEAAPPESTFYLAQAHAALAQHGAAITAYESYVTAVPQLGAYIYPTIGEAYLAQGERENAIAAYEQALTAPRPASKRGRDSAKAGRFLS